MTTTTATWSLECNRCGVTFVQLARGRRARYCPVHRAGGNRGWAAQRACLVCGAGFWPRKPNATRCPAHQGHSLPWRDRRPDVPRIRGTGSCIGCGQAFAIRTYGQRACSRACSIDARRPER
jgi:hypothetical protein